MSNQSESVQGLSGVSPGLAELIQALCERTKFGCVDLRYLHRDNRWALFVPHGNVMTILGGSIHDTPEECVRYAINAWDNRSYVHPFNSMEWTDAEVRAARAPAAPLPSPIQ